VRKYRKKPVVITAYQWMPGSSYGDVEQIGNSNAGVITTLEGVMSVQCGDFIITGVKGEKYACKPDIFHLTYEEVEE
jgi:hypothetical protein